MRHFNSLILISLIWLAGSHTASADLVISLDVSPGQDGIQSRQSLAAQDEFDLVVNVQLDDPETIAGYGFRIRYDADEFTFVSRTQTSPVDFEDSPNNNNRSGNDDSRLGIGTNFQEVLVGAVDFLGSAEPLRGPSSHELATIRFRVNEPDSEGPDFAISFNPVFDGIFDENLNLIPESRMELGTASVVAIPEPTTVVVTCFGLMLFARRRRRIS